MAKHRRRCTCKTRCCVFFVENAPVVPDISEARLLAILTLARNHPQEWQRLARSQFLAIPRRMVVPTPPVIRGFPQISSPRDKIIHGRFEECAGRIAKESVDLVVTSPPYAMQRSKSYASVAEHKYPEWTSWWMSEVRRVLKPTGSVALIIRPHVKAGRLVSYVRYTIEWLEQDGWVYCDEFHWTKPDAPPLGNRARPRRSWESIHWFALSPRPYCEPRAGGNFSNRIGLESKKGVGRYIIGASNGTTSGIARVSDVMVAPVASVDRSEFNTHPAQFPVQLAEQLIMMLCPKNGLVLDPFMGSGSTAVAALSTGRHFVGFEKNGGYVNIARKRVAEWRQNCRHHVSSAPTPPRSLT